MARNYNTPFCPYPLVDATEIATTNTAVGSFVVPIGGLVQQKSTNKVWRLVEFVVSPSADIDFAAKLLVHYVGDTHLAATSTFQVAQDFSDTGGVPAGVCHQAIDVSAHSTNLFGYIQVGGECEVTNHDGTCPINAALASHGTDAGETDVAAAGEAIIGVVVDEEGSTTPVVKLTLPSVMQVEVMP